MRKLLSPRATALAVCLATLVALPALADSTSSASSAASTSIGSSSASIEKSSNSSSAKDRVAQGHYTVVAVAEVAQQPGMLRVQLQAVLAAPVSGTDTPAALAPNAVTTTTDFFLTLPRATAERAQLAAGQTITAEQRPYGLAFALVNTATGTTRAFFLVLDDAWFRELESHPVGV
jgi:hypothetical protein